MRTRRRLTLGIPSPLDLFAIPGAVFVANAVAGGGEAIWFEGVLLVGVGVLFARGFSLGT